MAGRGEELFASGNGVVVGKTYCSLCTKEQIQNGPL